tara:strand:+ start:30293 stop:30643 length:351 start_codon:yes stop_codon:yes gene_type:complete
MTDITVTLYPILTPTRTAILTELKDSWGLGLEEGIRVVEHRPQWGNELRSASIYFGRDTVAFETLAPNGVYAKNSPKQYRLLMERLAKVFDKTPVFLLSDDHDARILLQRRPTTLS